ncbi:MAG: hypothetical protein IH623_07240 [Verrucomicrobia bacterium]|nr:hypothetical protein [Verrucomicrobiota bacterium]
MKRASPKQSLAQRTAKVLARLTSLRGMSDDEKALHALGLAATPEERWKLVRNHIRLFNSSPRSRRKA